MQAVASGPQDRLGLAESGRPPLIVHVIFHLGVGGLENGLVNLINHIPPERYRHAIVCLKGYSDFRERLKRRDVEIVALNKREGQDFNLYLNLFKTLRRLKPDIVHTRNLSGLEGQLIAALAGARIRIHGEHGRDIFDLHGKNRRYNLLRKAIRPFVGHFIAVSKDLESWLVNTVGATPERVDQIYNGVDSVRFYPRESKDSVAPKLKGLPEGFLKENAFVVGSVGRMADIKNYPGLIDAFLLLLKEEPAARERLRLVVVGDGNSRARCINRLREAGAEGLAWFPGERADIPELMRAMDLFVLPSLSEGISNTILEAMSTGLPVVATRVGGNEELIQDDVTGALIPADSPTAMAAAILKYYTNPDLMHKHGRAGRRQIEASFSMEAMTQGYLKVYDKILQPVSRP
jgi:sugar transferase (PEP-CTERM/EpsH1 system associated)